VCVFHSTEFFAADDSRLLRTSFSAAESLVRVCPRKSAADFTSSLPLLLHRGVLR
jgi:hypothetical protein